MPKLAKSPEDIPKEFRPCRIRRRHSPLYYRTVQGATAQRHFRKSWTTEEHYCEVCGMIIRQVMDTSGRTFGSTYDPPDYYHCIGGVPPEVLDQWRLDYIESQRARVADDLPELTHERVRALRGRNVAPLRAKGA